MTWLALLSDRWISLTWCTSYSSTFNIIAVVAGFFVRFGLPGTATAVLITPEWKLLAWSALIGLALVLLWWLDKNLQSEEVRALLREKKLHQRWPKLVPSIKVVSIFCAVLALVIVAWFTLHTSRSICLSYNDGY